MYSGVWLAGRVLAAFGMLSVLAACVSSTSTPEGEQRGHDIYMKSCVSCHAIGASGDSFRSVPALAGQRYDYLLQQIERFSRQERPSSDMHWAFQRHPLSEVADREALSVYLSRLKAPRITSTAGDRDVRIGQALFERRCVGCHSADAGPSVPRVAHQHYSYLSRRLVQIADGRDKSVGAEMAASATALSRKELWAVANYLSTLPAEN